MPETIDFKKNGLNLFRLLAAVNVLYGHTLEHLELPSIPVFGDFIWFFSGVPIFFTLSGYLIWQSIGRSNSFFLYVKKRFWRIYPELWVAVAVEIFVICVLYRQPIDWTMMGAFVFGQTTFFQFWTPDFLRGYGCGCPNGALWTITVLIQYYFLSYYIYKWLHNKKITVWGGVGIVFCLISWQTPLIEKCLPLILGKIYGVSLIPYLWMFILAAFVSEHNDNILPFLKNYWWIFFTLLLLNKEFMLWDAMLSLYPLLNTIFLFCGLLGFAHSFPNINVKTDISYGVYIYHMTIVNALIVLGYIGQCWTLFFVIAVTCFLAWSSTVTVGKWSANKKNI